jgi:hypothetical protein
MHEGERLYSYVNINGDRILKVLWVWPKGLSFNGHNSKYIYVYRHDYGKLHTFLYSHCYWHDHLPLKSI